MAGLGNEDYFNPSLSDPSTSFLHYSRGVERPEAQQYQSTTAPLLKGIGDEYGLITEATDTDIKQDIKDQVSSPGAIVDTARENDSNRLIQGQQPNAATDAIDGKMTTMDQLNQARKSGKISETNYWMQLEAASRQLREQYPGHRDYIDGQFSQMTGHQPANALQASLRADAQAAGGQATKQNEFIESASKEGLISPELMIRMKSENVPFSDIVQSVASTKWTQAGVAFKKAQGDAEEADQKVRWGHYQDAAGLEYHQALQSLLPSQVSDYYEHVADINSGKYTREEVDKMHADFENVAAKIQASTSQIRSKWSGLLPQEKLDEVLGGKDGDADIKIIRHNFTDPNDGSLKWTGHVNQYVKDNVEGTLLKNPDYARGVQFAKDMGPQAFNGMLEYGDSIAKDSGGKVVSPYQNYVNMMGWGLFGKALDGDPKDNFTTHSGKIAEDTPDALGPYVDGYKKMITAKDADPQKKLNAITALYGDQPMPNMDTSGSDAKGRPKTPENLKLFSQITSPEMMKGVYDTKNPVAIKQLENYIAKGTQLTGSQTIADMTQAARAGVKFSYDPTNHTFDVAEPEKGFSWYADPSNATLNTNMQYAKVRAQDFNISIKPMVNMLQARGVKDADIPKELGKLLGPMGLEGVITPEAKMHLMGNALPGDNSPIAARGYGAAEWQGDALRENERLGAPQATPLAGMAQELKEALAQYKLDKTPESERYLKTIYQMYQDTVQQAGTPQGQDPQIPGAMITTAGQSNVGGPQGPSIPGGNANAGPSQADLRIVSDNSAQMDQMDRIKAMLGHPSLDHFYEGMDPKTKEFLDKNPTSNANFIRDSIQAEAAVKYLGEFKDKMEKGFNNFQDKFPAPGQENVVRYPDSKEKQARRAGVPDDWQKAANEAAAEDPKVNDQLTVQEMHDAAQGYKPYRETGKAITNKDALAVAKNFKIDTAGQKVLGELEKNQLANVRNWAAIYSNKPTPEFKMDLMKAINRTDTTFLQNVHDRETVNKIQNRTQILGKSGPPTAVPTEVPGLNLTGGGLPLRNEKDRE